MQLSNKIQRIYIMLLLVLTFPQNLEAQVFSFNEALVTISNDTLKKENFLDKNVLINFWFIGCYPCMKEIPELNNIASRFKNEVTFIAVNKNNTKMQIEYFIKKFNFNFIQVLSNPDIIENLRIKLYPTTIIYNKKGEIVFRSEGFDEHTISSIENKIEELVKNQSLTGD